MAQIWANMKLNFGVLSLIKNCRLDDFLPFPFSLSPSSFLAADLAAFGVPFQPGVPLGYFLSTWAQPPWFFQNVHLYLDTDIDQIFKIHIKMI